MLHLDFSIGIFLAPLISLAVGSGKDANIYVLDRDNMGKFTANQNNVYELISGQLAGGEFAKPSYFNGTVYYGAVGDARRPFRSQTPNWQSHPHRKAQTSFRIQERRQASPPTALPTALCGRLKTGVQPCCTPAMPRILRANSITPTKPLTAATNSLGNKFITPIVKGRVYVDAPNNVAVFGLLP